jgi:hypothetical protein
MRFIAWWAYTALGILPAFNILSKKLVREAVFADHYYAGMSPTSPVVLRTMLAQVNFRTLHRYTAVSSHVPRWYGYFYLSLERRDTSPESHMGAEAPVPRLGVAGKVAGQS